MEGLSVQDTSPVGLESFDASITGATSLTASSSASTISQLDVKDT